MTRRFSQLLQIKNIALGEKEEEEEGVTIFCAGSFIFLRREGKFIFVSLQCHYGLIGGILQERTEYIDGNLTKIDKRRYYVCLECHTEKSSNGCL